MITKRDVSLFFCCAALTVQFILCVFFVGAFIGVVVRSFFAGKEYVVGQFVGFAVPLLLEIVVCAWTFYAGTVLLLGDRGRVPISALTVLFLCVFIAFLPQHLLSLLAGTLLAGLMLPEVFLHAMDERMPDF